MSQENNYWQRKLDSGRVTRRRFVGGAAAAGVGAASLGVVGCGGDSTTTSTATTASGGATPGASAAASPTAAAAAPVDGGIWRATLGATQWDKTDIHRASRDEVGWLSNSILSKIIRFANADAGDLEGDLAEKWETPDSQTFTFTMRKGVKWQNTPLTKGRAVTSADIKWHIERQQVGKLLDGTAPLFRFQSAYAGIKVETPDESTVKLTLPAPNGTFLMRLAQDNASVPNREATEKFESSAETLTEEAMPATGAYTLKQWRGGKDALLQKNPDYWDKGLPHFDGGVYPTGLFQDTTAYRLAFEQKQVEAWASPDASVTKSVIDANKDRMHEILTGVSNTVLLHLNVNKQFKDNRLVRAMNMAVDRRAIIQSLHQGLGAPSGTVPWLQEGFAIKPADLIKLPGYRVDRAIEIKEARDLWNAGGGPALGDVDIKIEVSFAASWPDTYQIIAKMFNDAFGVTQFKSTKATYNDDIIPNLAKGEYPNWMAWTNAVTSPDPRLVLYSHFNSKGAENYSHVNDPALDKLLSDAILASDLTKARDLTLQAQKIIMENAMYGELVQYNYISRSARWNYAHSPLKSEPGPGKAAEGYWNTANQSKSFKESWFDPKDPSYADGVKNRTLG